MWVTHLILLKANVKGPCLNFFCWRRGNPEFPNMPLDTPFLIASLIQPLHFLSRIMLPSQPRYRMSLPGSRCIRALRQSQVHSQDTQSCSDLPHPCMEYGSGYTPFVKLTSTGFLPHFNLSLLSSFYSCSLFLHSLFVSILYPLFWAFPILFPILLSMERTY